MTQEDKELLFKDLCARLLYGVKCKIAHSYKDKTKDKITQDVVTLTEVSRISPECYFEETDEYEKTENVKPYLRPMSSMTDGEKKELLHFGGLHISSSGEVIDVSCVGFERHSEVQYWLNAHHFDYRGLIKKSLALKAPEGMYN